MALDFTTASLDPRVAVARALDTATRINSSGIVEIVNANLPRFDYDPVTLLCKGLLIEEARTNLALQSDLLTTPTWAGLRADRTTSGDYARLTANTTSVNGAFWTYAGAVFAAGSYTLSINISKTSASKLILRIASASNGLSFASVGFNPATGIATATTAAVDFSSASVTVTDMGSDWRVSLTGTTTGSISIQPRIWISDAATGISVTLGANIDVRYAQFETGAFATSYIPTTLLAVLRNADVVTMTGTNFSDWYNATSGAILARSRQSVITGTRPSIYISDGTADNIISLRGVGANPELYIKATTDQAQIDAGTLTANSSFGLVGAWTTDNCAAAINGGAAVTDTSATIPTVDQMLIGSDGTNYLNGQVERISYWPQRIINAEAQAFSK
jgi:hypothetical protein